MLLCLEPFLRFPEYPDSVFFVIPSSSSSLIFILSTLSPNIWVPTLLKRANCSSPLFLRGPLAHTDLETFSDLLSPGAHRTTFPMRQGPRTSCCLHLPLLA